MVPWEFLVAKVWHKVATGIREKARTLVVENTQKTSKKKIATFFSAESYEGQCFFKGLWMKVNTNPCRYRPQIRNGSLLGAIQQVLGFKDRTLQRTRWGCFAIVRVAAYALISAAKVRRPRSNASRGIVPDPEKGSTIRSPALE